jgi:hypothetical protein
MPWLIGRIVMSLIRTLKLNRSSFSLLLLVIGLLCIRAVYVYGFNGPAIRSDGVGYYLYLPATLVYHDLSLHSIAVSHFDGHIPDWTGANLIGGTQGYLIKYPAGEAILMLPFFLLACISAYLVGLPVDGFSFPFQVAGALSGLCYAVAGIYILWGVLARRFQVATVQLALVGIVFGTSLFHYATYDSIFSHAYSFFLVSVLLCLIDRLYVVSRLGDFLLAGATAGMIVIVRPTNALWLLFALAYGISSVDSLIARLTFMRTHAAKYIYGTLAFLAVVSVQLAYWKLTTGNYVVYAYQGESFNFLAPEVVNVLFSVRKGLFFWAPLALLSLLGVPALHRLAPEYFLPVLIYFPLNVYVISSWYCWWYGGSFGSRPFVEASPIFALALCALYEGAASQKAKKLVFFATIACAGWTTWLMKKYWLSIIPFDGVTLDFFVDRVLKLGAN